MGRTVYYDYQGNEVDPPFEPPVVTNADRIRSMTDGELAEWIGLANCPRENCMLADDCTACWFEWLKSPAEKGEE